MSAVMVSMAVLIRTFSCGIHTHTPCLLKLCIPPSNGTVRWRLFPEFGAELSLDNCTTTIILNNPVLAVAGQVERLICVVACWNMALHAGKSRAVERCVSMRSVCV